MRLFGRNLLRSHLRHFEAMFSKPDRYSLLSSSFRSLSDAVIIEPRPPQQSLEMKPAPKMALLPH